ncbi:hypothetical protein [Rheinheimera sp. 4Y26]|uniref:hypothetical protein n=1 Tax=Rheinheimera sp. 4Y26 TaxID=2977811 RepID=UPI0021B13A7A|nr:hypothetical protein [Rheinheimera sp. 4Y26]MCT6700260.1 hypothetical protein [Rheinheimera sp. 4Y26]
MKLNTHQQQLLQILRIKPLNLHADFLSFSEHSAAKNKDNTHQHQVAAQLPASTEQVDAEFSALMGTDTETAAQSCAEIEWPLLQLQQDIQLLLQQKSRQLSTKLSWQTKAELTDSYLDGQLLCTPDLQNLTNAQSKRQLWQLFNNGWSDV